MSAAIPTVPSPPEPPGPMAGCPANRCARDSVAELTSAATGFRSMASVSSPSRIASVEIAPPPQNGVDDPRRLYRRPTPRRSAALRPAGAASPLRSQRLSSSINASSRRRSSCCAASVGYRSGRAEGSSTSEGEQRGTRHPQRLARPPQVHRGRMSLLGHRLLGSPGGVHRLQRQGHLDQFARRRAQGFKFAGAPYGSSRDGRSNRRRSLVIRRRCSGGREEVWTGCKICAIPRSVTHITWHTGYVIH